MRDAAPPWPSRPRPAPASSIPGPAGWTLARGLIHVHSVHSHDACDGEPKPEGMPDLECLADLRASLCHNRFDFTLLTDHPDSMAEVDFPDALLIQEGDRPLMGDEGPIANRIPCEGGGEVLLAAGNEGDLMPVMLRRHPEDRGHYRNQTPEGVAALREAGALVFVSHTEGFTVDELRALGLDGLEIYNIHANLDPNWVQLGEVLPDLAATIEAGRAGLHPDLAALAILRANPVDLANWDALLPEGRLLGFAASDVHQNIPEVLFPTNDGERMDSYRRIGSWFSNWVLVREFGYEALREAVAEGRLWVVFDVMGPPTGFDFAAEVAGQRVETGAEVAFAEGSTLRVSVAVDDPLSVRLYRITAEGSELVAETGGALEHVATGPGAYRIEVWRTPESLRGELGTLGDRFVRPTIWLYTNPIYLR